MKNKTTTSLLMGLLAVSLAASPCYASTQQKITDTQNAQQENQQKLDDAQSRINSLESKKDDLEGYLQELNQQLGDLEENLQEIQTKSDETQKTLEKLEKELEAAKEKEAQQYNDMKLRIQYMYENAEGSYVVMLLESNSISDFLSQAENMSQITNYDRDMLEEYKKTTEEIQEKEASIQEEQQELEELKQQSLDKQDEIYEVVKTTNLQIQDYEGQISQEEGNAEKLMAQIESQKDTINSLIKQQKDEEAAQIQAQRQAEAAAEQQQAASESSQSSQENTQTTTSSSSSSSESSSGSQESQSSDSGSGNTYLGRFRLTGYCPCAQCCGKSDGITASGTQATAGRTVAMGGVPLGTKLMINGTIYTVEDRGTSYGHVDIFFNTHGEALQFGSGYADVYQVN
ncbi:PcsB-like coiled-coil domain-containing protein [Blautia sp. An46]|uniref:PcsB-like coiled-coil domain-containing protein n=1 Tax=Blautia sp. An46 TaxID=1965636 RepID=UPI000B39E632|nr:hypothetical protein [Blautia sp. An46]OUN93404.1 hypothetical protein B5G00_05575 [Blautia sp. An46]HJD35502.1 hypothetical protein [Candidatus Blautia ornithocaccae]